MPSLAKWNKLGHIRLSWQNPKGKDWSKNHPPGNSISTYQSLVVIPFIDSCSDMACSMIYVKGANAWVLIMFLSHTSVPNDNFQTK